MMNRIIKYISFVKAKYTQKYYNIGFASFTNDIKKFAKIKNVRWLNNPNTNKWYADPFILDYDEDIITVFVEEMDYNVRKGILTELIIDRHTMNVIKSYELLNLSTHLSFPAILRIKDDIFVYPENSKSGNTYIYRYNRNTHKLVEPKLIAKFSLTDAIFIDNNCDYLLATDSSNPNGCTTTLYKKGIEYYEPLYKYDMHGNIARNAGAVFWVEGKLVRPAQDCNKGYGKGVVFQTIEQDQIGKVTFSTIDSLYPINSEYDKGLHTFNVYHDLIVIDSYREPNKYLSFVILKIINMMLYIRNVLKI